MKYASCAVGRPPQKDGTSGRRRREQCGGSSDDLHPCPSRSSSRPPTVSSEVRRTWMCSRTARVIFLLSCQSAFVWRVSTAPPQRSVNSVLGTMLRETWYAHCVFLANLTEGENSHDERSEVQVDVVDAAHFCDLAPIPCTLLTLLFFWIESAG